MKSQDADISEYITKEYIHNFLNGHFPDTAPITKKIILPKLGSHLVTPRTAYTHHGIYIGEERVIHYSGLSDGLQSGPVEELSLNKFKNGQNFTVKLHPDANFTENEIICRAKKRLNEKNYNLFYNNCEHFINYCIYNIKSSEQVGAVLKTGVHTAMAVLSRSNPATAIATGVVHSSQYIVAYIKGEIPTEKLLKEISHSAVTGASSFYYATLGQVAIPIPVLGALIGATVGYFIGNMLNKSGLIALGDSKLVREAKERRKNIEDLCQHLIPEIKKSRKKLDEYINQYFSDRKIEFSQAFSLLDSSLTDWNPDHLVLALNKINKQFFSSLQFQTFQEFDKFMKTEEALDF